MLFNSMQFLIFFPIVLLVYYIVPKKVRYIWLLAASYYFYMCWNAKYALLLLFSTVVTYCSGLLLEKAEKMDQAQKTDRSGETDGAGKAGSISCKKLVVAGSFVLNLLVLFYFKYINFALSLVQGVFSLAHIQLNVPSFDIILPVGISFFTFQALSYTMDVYRGEIYAEHNFLRYALFVSFFPQLVAGPIERSKNLLKQLAVPKPFDFDRAREGVLLMLWGYFLKLVLADRIAIFVDAVYNNYNIYGGWYIVVATVLFAFQIYCDFAGYSVIAMGAAKIIGVNLMENFDAPYLAADTGNFWRRWHISLTSWFTDYVYIPLGGSRKGKARKYINKMIVFLISGLWHGASLSFVIWGGLNGLYQVIGEILMPIRNRVAEFLHLHRDSIGHRILSTAVTFVLVDFAWLFFRAETVTDSIGVLKQLFTVHNPWILFDGSLFQLGLDEKNFHLMMNGIILLLAADVCKYRKIRIRDIIAKQDGWFRYLFIAASVCAIVTLGVWGPGYSAANFIYFQF